MTTSIRVPASVVAVIERTLDALRERPERCTKMLPQWLPNGEEIQTLSQLAAVLSIDEKMAAYVVLDSYNPPAHLWLKADAYVRTPAGAIKYGQPIGTRIVRDKSSWRKRISAAAAAGGLTLSFLSGSSPTTGYVVAQQGSNKEIPDAVFFDPDKGIDELMSWVREHEDDFDKPNAHLGVWHDTKNGEVVLDVSFVIGDRNEAVKLGQTNNQQAIYDIAKGEEIPTGGTGDRQEKSDGRHVSGEAAEEGQGHDRRGTPRVALKRLRARHDQERKDGRHVRDSAFWGAPVGTPLPLARHTPPPVAARGGVVNEARRYPSEPAPIDTAGMSGADIMSALVIPPMADSINTTYRGGKPPSDKSTFLLPLKYDERHSYRVGTTNFEPNDYTIRRQVRAVHPLEPHSGRDIKWPYSKKPNQSILTDSQTGEVLVYGINTVIDTSPPNPKTPNLANVIRMWVEGHPPRQYTRDFPYVGEIRAAATQIMGLRKQPANEGDPTPIQREHAEDGFPIYSAAEVRAAARTLITAIGEAPPSQPDLFRGFERIVVSTRVKPGRDGIEYSYKPGLPIPEIGDTFTIPPSSFSRDPFIATGYAGSGIKNGDDVPAVIVHVVPGSRGIKDTKWIPTDQEVITGGKFRVLGVNVYESEHWDSHYNSQADKPKYMKYERYTTKTIVIDVEQVDVPHAKK